MIVFGGRLACFRLSMCLRHAEQQASGECRECQRFDPHHVILLLAPTRMRPVIKTVYQHGISARRRSSLGVFPNSAMGLTLVHITLVCVALQLSRRLGIGESGDRSSVCVTLQLSGRIGIGASGIVLPDQRLGS
jgi:hypothetical protein